MYISLSVLYELEEMERLLGDVCRDVYSDRHSRSKTVKELENHFINTVLQTVLRLFHLHYLISISSPEFCSLLRESQMLERCV